MSETPGVPPQPGSAQLERLQQLDRRIAETVGQLIGSLQEEVDRRLYEATGELQRLFEKMKPTAPDLPGAFLQYEDLSGLMSPAPVPVPVPVKASLNESLAPLLAGLSRIDGESGQAPILKALLEEALRFASRAAFLLIRGGEVRGWAAQGLPEAEMQQTNFAAFGGPFTRLLSADGTIVLSAQECAAVASALNVAAAAGGVLVPFQIRGQLAGALYADQLDAGEEMAVAALQVLAYGAAQALETSQLRKGPASALRLGAGEQLPEPPAPPALEVTAPVVAVYEPVAAFATVPPVEPAAEYDVQTAYVSSYVEETPAPSYEPPPSYEPAPSYEPEPTPSYAAPSYEPEPTPSYAAPSYDAPAVASSYETPSYEAPSYEAPSYTAPSYEAPSYEAPAHEAATFAAPAYDTSSPAAPAYEAPSYEIDYEAPAAAASYEIQYDAPLYEAPSYAAPQYEAPQYEAPSYAAPSWEAPSAPAVSAPSAGIAYPSSFEAAPSEPAYEPAQYEPAQYEPAQFESAPEPAPYEPAAYVPTMEPAAYEPTFEMVPEEPAVSFDSAPSYEVSYGEAAYEVTYEPSSEPSSFDTSFEPAAAAAAFSTREDVRFAREAPYELPSEEEIALEKQPEPALEDTNIWEAEEDDEPTQVGQSTAPVPTVVPAAPALGQQTVRLDISQLQSHATQLAQERFGEDTAEVKPPAAAPTWAPAEPAAPTWAAEPAAPAYSPASFAAPPSFATPPSFAASPASFAAPPSFAAPSPPAYDQSEAPTMLGAAPAKPASPSPAGFAGPAPTEQAPGGFGAGGFGASDTKEPGGSTEVRPPVDLVGPGRAFASQPQTPRPGPSAGVEETLREEAKRLARLLVSEIKLYNEEIIEEGRRSGNIYDRLKDDIDRSRQMYEERIDPRLTDQEDYFYQELVQRLAGGDVRLLGL